MKKFNLQKHIPFFDFKNIRVVHIPIEKYGEYGVLSIDSNINYSKRFSLVGLYTALGIFLILLMIDPIIVFSGPIFFTVLILSQKYSQKLSNWIPFLVYKKMKNEEINDFLKEHPGFKNKQTKTPNFHSKIKQSEKEYNNRIKDVDINNDSVGSKSIFDNYESVMDKFNKK